MHLQPYFNQNRQRRQAERGPAAHRKVVPASAPLNVLDRFGYKPLSFVGRGASLAEREGHRAGAGGRPFLNRAQARLPCTPGCHGNSRPTIVLPRRHRRTTPRTRSVSNARPRFDILDSPAHQTGRCLNACYWKRWRYARTRRRELIRLGVPRRQTIRRARSSERPLAYGQVHCHGSRPDQRLARRSWTVICVIRK